MPTLEGPGVVTHIWMTAHAGLIEDLNCLSLRIYYDGRKDPGVEAPLGAFFAVSSGRLAPVNSFPVLVSESGSLTSYWRMPFARSCRITVTNDHPSADDRPLLAGRLHDPRFAAPRHPLLPREVPAGIPGRRRTRLPDLRGPRPGALRRHRHGGDPRAGRVVRRGRRFLLPSTARRSRACRAPAPKTTSTTRGACADGRRTGSARPAWKGTRPAISSSATAGTCSIPSSSGVPCG